MKWKDIYIEHMTALEIGECSKCSHLFFPGDDIKTVNGLTYCSDCDESEQLPSRFYFKLTA